MSTSIVFKLALVATLFSSSHAAASNSSNIGSAFGASVGANQPNLTSNSSVSPASTSSSKSAYYLVKDYSGETFFNDWWFYNSSTGPDPTQGFVNYTDFWTTKEQELAGFIWDERTKTTSAYIGVEHKNKAPNGRNSVRITSTDAFSNGGLFLADVLHTPLGICGTWPALWMTGPDWPNGGEIDVMEGVNDNAYNSMTLHTSNGCTIDNDAGSGSAMIGKLANDNCYAYANGNAGCGITAPYAYGSRDSNNLTARYPTSGQGFNAIGGGVYATLWTDEGISIYMFPRLAIPQDIQDGKPDPTSWTATPLAKFAGSGCDYRTRFSELNLVVNTDFCGSWAGEVWCQSACAKKWGGSCEDFVANNPEQFKDAYWDIKSIMVYQTEGSMGTASVSPASNGTYSNGTYSNGTYSNGTYSNGTYRRDELSAGLPMMPRRGAPVETKPLQAEATHAETMKSSSSPTYYIRTDGQGGEHLMTATAAAASEQTSQSHSHTEALETLSTHHHPHGPNRGHGNGRVVNAHLHSHTTTRSAQVTGGSNGSGKGTTKTSSSATYYIRTDGQGGEHLVTSSKTTITMTQSSPGQLPVCNNDFGCINR